MSSVDVYNNYHSSVPEHHQSYGMKPMSKTMQYRKVMKPLLERKRRARINKSLDELKDLMIAALAMDEENIAKLEKADILEITVAHLQKLKRQKQLLSNPVIEADRFRSGYTTCAKEVSRVLASTPEVDIQLGTQLMTHLGHQLNQIDNLSRKTPVQHQTEVHHHNVSSPLMVSVGPPSDMSEEVYQRGYPMPLTPPSSRGSPSPVNISDSDNGKMWRPW